jgi:hypothetical protein
MPTICTCVMGPIVWTRNLLLPPNLLVLSVLVSGGPDMMNQVVAGPETYSYNQTYYLNLSQGPGYDEPGGSWTRNLLLPPNLLS